MKVYEKHAFMNAIDHFLISNLVSKISMCLKNRNTTLKIGSLQQTFQVSMLRMSEKFVESPKNFPSVASKILFWPSRGFRGHAPQKILKIMYPRLAKIAFHGISAVKIKCHLTIYLKHLINLAFFIKCVRIFLPCV